MLLAIFSLVVNSWNWKLPWLLLNHIPKCIPVLVHLSCVNCITFSNNSPHGQSRGRAFRSNIYRPPIPQTVRHSISIAAWISLHSAYDVMTMPLMTRVIQMRQIFHLFLKNWVVRSLHILQRVSYDDLQNPENCIKILGLVSETFFETEIVFPPSPLQGAGAKILFLSTQRPQLHTNFRAPRTSHFGDLGSEVQLPHHLPKNWVGRSLHILHRVS